MNRPNMEFPEFPSEKSRSKAGAWVRKGLVLSDRKRKLSIQIQIQYKYRSTAHRFSLRCQLKGEILTENILTGCCTSPFLPPPNPDTLVHLVQKRSGCGGTLGAHWYTKATLTSTSLQNCYSDTLIQLVPTPNQRELLIDCSA